MEFENIRLGETNQAGIDKCYMLYVEPEKEKIKLIDAEYNIGSCQSLGVGVEENG